MTLYSKQILSHVKALSDQHPPTTVTHTHRLSNPICGDRVEWQLYLDRGQIIDAWVEAKGCALCKASAALLLDGIIEQTREDVSKRIEHFLADVDGILNGNSTTGEASLFAALDTAPARQECVVLPWVGFTHCLSKE